MNITHPHLTQAQIEKFCNKVYRPLDMNGCWKWIGYRDKDGYGTFTIGRGWTVRAAKLSYELFLGVKVETPCILHICDNPSCVNPNHLKPGTHKENMKDKLKKGRGRNQNSERESRQQRIERNRRIYGGVL